MYPADHLGPRRAVHRIHAAINREPRFRRHEHGVYTRVHHESGPVALSEAAGSGQIWDQTPASRPNRSARMISPASNRIPSTTNTMAPTCRSRLGGIEVSCRLPRRQRLPRIAGCPPPMRMTSHAPPSDGLVVGSLDQNLDDHLRGPRGREVARLCDALIAPVFPSVLLQEIDNSLCIGHCAHAACRASCSSISPTISRMLHSRSVTPAFIASDMRTVRWRARAPFKAISRRCSGVSFAARAGPPFWPPSVPSATAARFFVGLGGSSDR